jgi:hypothetical protein
VLLDDPRRSLLELESEDVLRLLVSLKVDSMSQVRASRYPYPQPAS